MRWRIRVAGAATAAIAALCLPAAALAASPADWMYKPTTFTEIRLTLPQSSFETLEAHPEDAYVPGTFSIAETDGTPDGTGPFSTPIEVGIRLKGNVGSLRSINEKAAFKLKFNSFVKGQAFDGLEKMTLNNMVQDATMTHEVLAYRAFHEMGVYAPHTGYAYLWVNGKSYGLHLNVETQDKVALEKQFGPFQNPPQHLYEGEDGADVSSAVNSRTGHPRWEDLEVDEGKSGTKTDLAALLAAVEGTTGTFSERVAPYADLAEMTRMWMTEKYIGHWDGYSGRPTDTISPNNYYLFSDASGRFQMLPWGTDQTWDEQLGFAAPGGALFTDCLADTGGCLPSYRAAGAEALSALTEQSLDDAARCTAATVMPWREYEIDESEAQKLPPYDLQETVDGVAEEREFIAERPQQLAAYLGVAAPAPSREARPCPPLRPIGGFQPPLGPPPSPPAPTGANGQAAAQPPPQSAAAARTPLAITGHGVRADAIVVRVSAAVGRLELRGTIGPAGRRVLACSGSARLAAAGPASVECRFTAAFARRLEDRPARLRLTAKLTPASGEPRAATRTIWVPRR